MYYLAKNIDDGFYFPFIDPRMRHMTENGPFDDWLWKKYTNEYVYPEPDDVVIDCGGFVGAFSVSCAKRGNKVHVIEPTSINVECINKNIDHYNLQDKVTCHRMGLGNENKEMKLNLSKLSCENSFLSPDVLSTGEVEIVKCLKTKTFISDLNIDANNLFLKVEAEGFEPEILIGLEELRPKCIAVDVSAERNNQSPRNQINKLLVSFGYKIYDTKRCTLAYHE